jgi:hypothetical protein
VNVSKTSTPEELSFMASQAGFADVRTRGGTLWVTGVARKPAATAAGCSRWRGSRRRPPPPGR